MNVTDLIKRAEVYLGHEISVEGIIFIHGNPERDRFAGKFLHYYLAPERVVQRNLAKCIFLNKFDLEPIFRSNGLMSRAGGIYNSGFSDRCKVTGIFGESSKENFPFEIRNLEAVTIWWKDIDEEEEEIVVDLNRGKWTKKLSD